DWLCVAIAGRDAPMPTIRGTYNSAGRYDAFDIVALNGSSFIARKSDPGACPGDDWQLIASAGKPGRQGPKGERGDQGARGMAGGPGPALLGWKIDRAAFTGTPRLSDPSEGPPLASRRPTRP